MKAKESAKSTAAKSLGLSKREKQKLLSAKYTPEKRRMEKIAIAVFFSLFTVSLVRLWQATIFGAQGNAYLWPLSFLLGWVLADLASGLVHWALDTWGSIDTPVVGATFIRSFREHHVDPVAMCKHDFVETNGDSCLAASPAVLACALAPHAWLLEDRLAFFLVGATVWGALGAVLTNQFHKWSHERSRPALVSALQQAHLVLPPRHHNAHHTPPFDCYYCITTGWLNPLLTVTRFWRLFESVIVACTGAEPRIDDLTWTQDLGYTSKGKKSE